MICFRNNSVFQKPEYFHNMFPYNFSSGSSKYELFENWLSEVNLLEMKTLTTLVCLSNTFNSAKPKISTKFQNADVLFKRAAEIFATLHSSICKVANSNLAC